ncbi:MAG: 2-oxoacid:acceptor oxidoreductase subunit alpha [Patescibacteria group bacterium]
MKQSVTWKIAGEAGFGIMSAGVMFARAFTRAGYHIFAINDYPSLIRGGHNVVTLRIATSAFTSMTQEISLLVGLNAETIEKHKEEVQEGTVVVYDPKDKEWTDIDFHTKVELVPLPLREIVSTLGADTIMRNTIALGASIALFGASFEIFSGVLRDQFIRKGQEVVDENIKIAKKGYDYIVKNYSNLTALYLDKGTYTEKLAVVNGSEALGLGAVKAGLKFAAIYPMTPINALISFLADHAKELELVYKQPEDEIAGINMAIGASLAGARSMVATSGGGFALMVEGLSLAGMIEVPIVIDLGMRVGPATGMPTYTEQGELLFAIYSGHGEFPRIVLAPADAKETFDLTILAFNLADKYQIPVFVLTDKYLNESQWCIPVSQLQSTVLIDRGKLIMGDTGKLEHEFKRYALETEDGVSVRSVPGTKNGQFYANSYEHDGLGHMTENARLRKDMVEKRLKKSNAIEKDMLPPLQFGDKDADITFVTWGSTRGVVLSAMDIMRDKGIKVETIYLPWLFPFPKDSFQTLVANKKRVIDIEMNATGQLAQLIRLSIGIEIKEKLLKYDGRPFFPEEIVELCLH